MRKVIAWLFALIALVAIAAVLFYKFYLPEMVATAIVKDKEPSYIPRFVRARIDEYKTPINKGAGDVIRELHRSNVSLQQILQIIDETDPQQVNALLAELGETRIVSTDQVFDISKKYIAADFDLEVLRRPFRDNVDTAMIRKGLRKAEYHKEEALLDPAMAKAIVKQILIQKEKEFNQAMVQGE